jgi:hypothetical protein
VCLTYTTVCRAKSRGSAATFWVLSHVMLTEDRRGEYPFAHRGDGLCPEMSLRGVKRSRVSRDNLPPWMKEIASGLHPRDDTFVRNLGHMTEWYMQDALWI